MTGRRERGMRRDSAPSARTGERGVRSGIGRALGPAFGPAHGLARGLTPGLALRLAVAVVLALAGLALAPAAPGDGARAAAQSTAERYAVSEDLLNAPQLVAVAGWYNRDGFFGEGPSELFGFRVRLPLSDWIVVEPGVHYTSFPPDTAGIPGASVEDPQLLLLDFQFQLQLPLDVGGPDRLRPWLGAGLGGGADFRDDRGSAGFLMGTLSASAGVSFDVWKGLSVLGEARWRAVDELDQYSVDAVFGVGWRP